MLKSSLIALAILLAVAPASAQAEMGHSDQMMMNMMMEGGKSPSEADKGYMEGMQKMQDTMMKTEMTGDPTGDFFRMMIPHHQSAIDMAEVLLKQDKVNPEIKRMAQKIIMDQKKEIEDFQKWLSKHKQ